MSSILLNMFVISISIFYQIEAWGIKDLVSNIEDSFDFLNDDGTTNTDTLILVHVLFRHGDRTTDARRMFPKDPYIKEKYYPYGPGQLTSIGKRKMYTVGKTLRKRYDKFLGEVYTPGLVDALSTGLNRTKMSLELVLAGLFPPVGEQIIEPGLNWQPVPYNYRPVPKDKILFGRDSSLYRECYNELLQTEELQSELNKHKKLFEYLSEHTGWNITTYKDVFNVFNQLKTEKEWGLQLPEWALSVYPETLEKLTLQDFYMEMATNCLRVCTIGHFLDKIVADTLEKLEWSRSPTERKIYLYSGHEFSMINTLMALDIFDKKLPTYGSYILFEVHQIQDVYGLKIYYEDYSRDKPRLMRLPDCDEFCPFVQFISIVKEFNS